MFETFQKSLVDKLNTAKYEAVPIEDYLIEFNGRVRRQALQEHASGCNYGDDYNCVDTHCHCDCHDTPAH